MVHDRCTSIGITTAFDMNDHDGSDLRRQEEIGPGQVNEPAFSRAIGFTAVKAEVRLAHSQMATIVDFLYSCLSTNSDKIIMSYWSFGNGSGRAARPRFWQAAR